MSAAKLTLPIDPAYTDADWTDEILFYTDPEGVPEEWTGWEATLDVVHRDKSLRADASFSLASDGAGGLIMQPNGVAIRVAASAMGDRKSGTYDFELRRRRDAATQVVLLGSITIETGLSTIGDNQVDAGAVSFVSTQGGVKVFRGASGIRVVRGGGATGESAYQADVRVNSFEGDEADWLTSLRAPALDAAAEANGARDGANAAAQAASEATAETNAVRDQTEAFLGQAQGDVADQIALAAAATDAANAGAEAVEHALADDNFKPMTADAYTVTVADWHVNFNFAGSNSKLVTIPPGLPNGFRFSGTRTGSGNVYFLAGNGVTLDATDGKLALHLPYALADIVSWATDQYVMRGGTTNSGPPGQFLLSNRVFAESAAPGFVGGQFSVSGSEVGDWTFTLDPLVGGGVFDAIGTYGQDFAVGDGGLDFENGAIVPCRAYATSTRDGSQITLNFNAQITDVLELIDFAFDTTGLPERSAQGVLAGRLVSNPTGATFTLVSDPDDTADGQVQQNVSENDRIDAGPVMADFETDPAPTFSVDARYRGEVMRKRFALPILDVTEYTGIVLDGSLLMEGSPQGTFTGTFTTVPAGGTVTLVDTAGDCLQSVANQLQAGSTLTNFEDPAGPTKTIRARVANAYSAFEQDFVISIGDANEAPTGATCSNLVVQAGKPEGGLIGYLTGIDPDAGDALRFAIINSGGGVAKVTGATGNELRTGPAGLYANAAITVRVFDRAGLFFDQVLNLTAQAFPMAASTIARYQGDNPNNTWSADAARAFTASDVSLPNNALALAGLDFPAKVGTLYGSAPVTFSTTGTLPGGLRADRRYWVEYDLTLGSPYLTIYPDAADAPAIPGHYAGDNILPAQNLVSRVNRIVLTDGGVGTHTLHCGEGFTRLADFSPDRFDVFPVVLTTRNNRMARIVDGDGHVSYQALGPMERGLTDVVYNGYGKELSMLGTGGSSKLAGRQKSAGARQASVSFVADIARSREFFAKRRVFASTGVNISTNVLTMSVGGPAVGTAHNVTNGDLAQVVAFSAGATVPGGLTFGADYYARVVTASTLTLHPTKADAQAGTNVIDITSTGTGSFSLFFPERSGDQDRAQFIIEWLDPVTGGNTCTPNIVQGGPNVNLVLETYPVIGGGSAGNITFLTGYKDLDKVYITVPPRALAPTCADTGLPLASGEYWVTASGASRRLHRTYASALESVGKSTSTSSCIKFTAAGWGTAKVDYADDLVGITFGANSALFAARVPAGRRTAVTFLMDWYPDVETKPVAKLYVNGAFVESAQLDAASGSKGLLGGPATDAGQPPWTPANSAAYHVPFKGKMYALVLDVTPGVIDEAAAILAKHQWWMRFYDIAA